MQVGTRERAARDGGSALADLIERHRDRIVARWCERARAELPAHGALSDLTLVDHVPSLLGEVVALLRRFAAITHDAAPRSLEALAAQHGQQRARVGLNLRAVVREYELLRQEVFNLVEETCTPVTFNELSLFSRAISTGVMEAVDRFSEDRDRALHEVEQRLRSVFSSGIVGALEWEASGAIIRANDTFLDMVGYTRADLEQGKLNFRALTPPEFLDVTEGAVRRLKQTGVQKGFEKQYLRKDGTRVDIEISAATLDEARERGIALVLDISERRRLEQKREERSRFEQELLAIVSHDLRSPLSAIALTAEALARVDQLEERPRRAAERIHASALRASDLIDDLLDYTSARLGGGISVHPAPERFHDIVTSVVEEVRAAHPERRIGLHTAGDDEGRWDRARLSQVVANLVNNAVQHSPPDTAVTVCSDASGDEVRLEVANEGAPIPVELRPYLFEPFRRGSEPGKKRLGLGLYIARTIVDAHHGRIDLRSDDEGHTVFSVTLPRELTYVAKR